VRLFLDLDDTLIHATRHDLHRIPEPDYKIELEVPYSVFLRPDIELLVPHSFSIFTAASESYMAVHLEQLRRRGYQVQEGFSREHMVSGEPIYRGPAVLIDDLGTNTVGVTRKLACLPQGHHVQVARFTIQRIIPRDLTFKQKVACMKLARYQLHIQAGTTLEEALLEV